MWRLLARRAGMQKQAMLGRIGSTCAGAQSAGAAPAASQLPSLGQALTATRGAFQAVKGFVSAAGEELHQLRGGLRFGMGEKRRQQREDAQAQQEGHPPPTSPPPQPVGSLQALLALLQPAPASPESAAVQPWQHVQLPAVPRDPGLVAQQADGWPPGSPGSCTAEQPSPHFPQWAPPHWSAIDTGSPGLGMPLRAPGLHAPGSAGGSPSYNPARYASPTKRSFFHHPEAIQAEMEGHVAAAAHIRRELEAFEQVGDWLCGEGSVGSVGWRGLRRGCTHNRHEHGCLLHLPLWFAYLLFSASLAQQTGAHAMQYA